MKTDSYKGFSKIINIDPPIHCGVAGCCEGGPMDGDRPYGIHGIRSEMKMYVLRKGDRAISMCITTGVYLPSVTWVAPEDRKPESWDLWWHEVSNLSETPCPFLDHKHSNCDGTAIGARDLFKDLLKKWNGSVPDDAIFDAMHEQYVDYWPADA